jgi:hypothetical protein
MKPCLTSIALGAAMSLAAAWASAQDTITLSTWGSGTLMIDELGLFGPPNKRPVMDLPFHFVMSVDTRGMQQRLRPGEARFSSVEGRGGQVGGVMSVNGQAWQWEVADHDSSAGWSRDGNSVNMFTVGTDGATGFGVNTHQELLPGGGSPQFIESDDYRDTVRFHNVYKPSNGDSGTYAYITARLPCEPWICSGTRQGLTLFFSSDPVHALWTVSAVPEPSTWLMLAGGLGLLAATRRARLLASAR